MPDVNWNKIKNEYINKNISYRKLAEKHGVSFQTLRDRAIKEKWSDSRLEQRNKIGTKTAQKTAEKIADQESDYVVNIGKLNFGLAEVVSNFLERKDGYVILEAKDVKALTGALKDIKEIQSSPESGKGGSKSEKAKLAESIKNTPDIWGECE